MHYLDGVIYVHDISTIYHVNSKYKKTKVAILLKGKL